MPFLGWLAGTGIIEVVRGYDHWIAFGLLAFVGIRMIWESRHSEDEKASRDYSRVTTLLLLSVATSLDALAVGFGLSFLHVGIAFSSAVIGAVAFAVTAGGFLLGTKLGKRAGKRAEIVGGVVLLAIGTRIVVSHLFG